MRHVSRFSFLIVLAGSLIPCVVNATSLWCRSVDGSSIYKESPQVDVQITDTDVKVASPGGHTWDYRVIVFSSQIGSFRASRVPEEAPNSLPFEDSISSIIGGEIYIFRDGESIKMLATGINASNSMVVFTSFVCEGKSDS